MAVQSPLVDNLYTVKIVEAQSKSDIEKQINSYLVQGYEVVCFHCQLDPAVEESDTYIMFYTALLRILI